MYRRQALTAPSIPHTSTCTRHIDSPNFDRRAVTPANNGCGQLISLLRQMYYLLTALSLTIRQSGGGEFGSIGREAVPVNPVAFSVPACSNV